MSSLERHTCVIRNSGRHNEPTQNEINKWCPLKLLHAYFSLNALDSPNTSTESATVAISSVDNNYNLDLISWTVGLFMERWEKSHWYSCITSNTIEDEVKSVVFDYAKLPAMMLGCCGCLPEGCFAVVGGCQAFYMFLSDWYRSVGGCQEVAMWLWVVARLFICDCQTISVWYRVVV